MVNSIATAVWKLEPILIFLFFFFRLIFFSFELASSTGLLLKTLGLSVTAIKIDPYLNIDAGTMAPTEHGKLMRRKKDAFMEADFFFSVSTSAYN